MKPFPFDRKKIIAVIIAAVVAVAAIITLYVTILPMDTDDASDEPQFTPQESFLIQQIGETFHNSYGNIIFTDISAHKNITADGKNYDGYYLIASAVATSESFLNDYGKESYGVLQKYPEEDFLPDKYEKITFQPELTSALSMHRSPSDESSENAVSENANRYRGEKNDDLLILKFVFVLTEEQYMFIYGSQNADRSQSDDPPPDICLCIEGCGYLAQPGVQGQTYTVFAFNEVRFEDPPESESTEQSGEDETSEGKLA